MPFSRSSGILLHPTSFPSRFGVGDLGQQAYRFIDFLVESGQQWWQVLPLGPTGYGNSPYMCYSALAGNPLLINPEKLQESGLLNEADLAEIPDFSTEQVDYEKVIPYKTSLLQKACQNFKLHATHEQQQAFQEFCASKTYWLNDYALFMALKEFHAGQSWYQWDIGISHRYPEAISAWKRQLQDEIFFHEFVQFEFFRQWTNLKQYANEKGIQIIGDIPIYVAHDSADVWAHPEIFAIDEKTGEASLMAGVPPDYFSATGQLWGNPVYNWEQLEENNFDWWIKRFQFMLDYVDVIRIDHFRGFQAYWAVPQGETTAMNGEWIEAPGTKFFSVLNEQLGKLPVLAEDLGVITPEVEALRDQFEFPGMKVLQFAFGSDTDNPFLPFNYPRNSVVYTGTHDNDTTVGWFHQLSDWEKSSLLRYLGCTGSEGIQWDLIRLAFSSVANQVIIPLQDLLGLGTQARMNFPGKAEGNWGWRYASEALTPELCHQLKTFTQTYGRLPKKHA